MFVLSILIGIVVGLWLGGFLACLDSRMGFIGALWTMTLGIPIWIAVFLYEKVVDAIERKQNK